MKITTKIGDRGKTKLSSGETVSKSDPLIEAAGTIDELSSALGLAKSLATQQSLKKDLENIQIELVNLGSELSMGKKKIEDEHILRVEKRIGEIEGKINLKKEFIIPGKSTISASIDLSRTICRRLERAAVKLNEDKRYNCEKILIYLNRLSYLLFLIAREQDILSS